MNQVSLMGRVTRDLELKYSKVDKPYTQFTIVVNRYSKEQEFSDFIDVIAFGKKAEILATHMQKGRRLLVRGRLSTDPFINEEGKKIEKAKVILEDFEFADVKRA